jgi:hypothetical protein
MNQIYRYYNSDIYYLVVVLLSLPSDESVVLLHIGNVPSYFLRHNIGCHD